MSSRMPFCTARPLLITVILSILAPFVSFLQIIPGDNLAFCLFMSALCWLYYAICAAWMWSGYTRLGVKSYAPDVFARVVFFTPAFIFGGYKFLMRYETFNPDYLGSSGNLSKALYLAGFAIYACSCFMTADAIERSCTLGAQPTNAKVLRTFVSTLFLPVGVWFLQPRLKRVVSMREAIGPLR